MKKLLAVFMLALPLWAHADPRVVEVEVSGLTCPFCAWGVERNVEKVSGVESCDVSVEEGKARIVLSPGATADIEAIKRAILDAGFSPGQATVPSAGG
jgi:copper chaperone CopZ